MFALYYKSNSRIEDLNAGECLIHRVTDRNGRQWWMLWFYVPRETEDHGLETFAVPVCPNGSFSKNGPAGKMWGLNKLASGAWQVVPSINVLNTREIVPGNHPLPSIWHQTPEIIGVPNDELWTT